MKLHLPPPTMADPDPFEGDPGPDNPYYDPAYEVPEVSETVRGGYGDHNDTVTPTEKVTSRFAIVVRRHENNTASGPAVHDIVNEVLHNLMNLDNSIEIRNINGASLMYDEESDYFSSDDSLEDFSPAQSHNGQKGMFGFIFEMDGRRTIEGYKGRYKRFREDLHPSVSLHPALGDSALVTEAGVIFCANPKANRQDLAAQYEKAFLACRLDSNTRKLRDLARQACAFIGNVPAFYLTSRKIAFKTERGSSYHKWPTVEVLQFMVAPDHTQYFSALVLLSLAQNRTALNRGKYYIPKPRESSTHLKDLCKAHREFMGQYSEVAIRNIPQGAIDIVIPDIKQSIRQYIVANIGFHVTQHPFLDNTEIIALSGTAKTMVTNFFCHQFPNMWAHVKALKASTSDL